MSSRVIAWSPGENSQFALNGTKLDLIGIQDSSLLDNATKKSLKSIHSLEPTSLSCMEWHPCQNSSFLAYGTVTGAVQIVNWQSPFDEVSVRRSETFAITVYH
jgi:hypothetical protein